MAMEMFPNETPVLVKSFLTSCIDVGMLGESSISFVYIPSKEYLYFHPTPRRLLRRLLQPMSFQMTHTLQFCGEMIDCSINIFQLML